MIRFFKQMTLLGFFLQACGGTSASIPTLQPDSLPTPTLTPSHTPAPATHTPSPTDISTPAPNIARVLIVSFDGLRPDAIQAAEMTTVMSLIQNGAYSLKAQTIVPSLTLPSHSSMLVGTCPAKHIVRWNEYVPENGYALGTDIFDVAHNAGLRTVFVAGKEKLRHITHPSSTDFFGFVDITDKINDTISLETMAIEEIRKGFDLMFLHFPDGDLAGHADGWMSNEQLLAYRLDDKSLGLILDVLKSRNLYNDTLIIITADHGGHDTTHGSDLPEDLTIPWVISGPRTIRGELITQIYTMDTAATVAFALGLPIPTEWDGSPVYEAFGLPIDPLRNGGCTGTP